jgi:hypothetical protein
MGPADRVAQYRAIETSPAGGWAGLRPPVFA